MKAQRRVSKVTLGDGFPLSVVVRGIAKNRYALSPHGEEEIGQGRGERGRARKKRGGMMMG